jgi:hypothetical protein
LYLFMLDLIISCINGIFKSSCRVWFETYMVLQLSYGVFWIERIELFQYLMAYYNPIILCHISKLVWVCVCRWLFSRDNLDLRFSSQYILSLFLALTTFSIVDSYIRPFYELQNTFCCDGYVSHSQYFFIYFLTVEVLEKKLILFRIHVHRGKITGIFEVVPPKETFFWIYCFFCFSAFMRNMVSRRTIGRSDKLLQVLASRNEKRWSSCCYIEVGFGVDQSE